MGALMPPPPHDWQFKKSPCQIGLELLNKFLGTSINNSKTEFCKYNDYFLFSVDREHYCTDIRLTTTKAWLLMSVALNKLVSFLIYYDEFPEE